MRPVRWDMHGFAAFREPDHGGLYSAPILRLVGPTGSGKPR